MATAAATLALTLLPGRRNPSSKLSSSKVSARRASADTAPAATGTAPSPPHQPSPELLQISLFQALSKAPSPIPLAATAASALTLSSFLTPQDALAIDGEFGLLEGRTLSLVHPAVMGGLFVYTLWAGYLGWQWRRVRTIQDDINDLKKQLKPAPAAVLSTGAEEAPAPPAAPSPVESKIQKLTEERKALLKGSYRERHFNAGSILLGFGVFESVGGAINTWFRTGKLFPGPHLFAGAVMPPWHTSQFFLPTICSRKCPRNIKVCTCVGLMEPSSPDSHHRSVGGCRISRTCNAERQRDGEEPAHHVECRECPALCVADPNWY